jgi:hypothetical protein
VRFERPGHITASENYVTPEHSHQGARVEAVGALADRPQGLRVKTGLPNVGVLDPLT